MADIYSDFERELQEWRRRYAGRPQRGDGAAVPPLAGARGDRLRRLPRGHARRAAGRAAHPRRRARGHRPGADLGLEGRGDARHLHPRRAPAAGPAGAAGHHAGAADGGRDRRMVGLGAPARALARGAALAGGGHARHHRRHPERQGAARGARAPALRPLPRLLPLQRRRRAHGLAVLGPAGRAGRAGARARRRASRRVPPHRRPTRSGTGTSSRRWWTRSARTTGWPRGTARTRWPRASARRGSSSCPASGAPAAGRAQPAGQRRTRSGSCAARRRARSARCSGGCWTTRACRGGWPSAPASWARRWAGCAWPSSRRSCWATSARDRSIVTDPELLDDAGRGACASWAARTWPSSSAPTSTTASTRTAACRRWRAYLGYGSPRYRIVDSSAEQVPHELLPRHGPVHGRPDVEGGRLPHHLRQDAQPPGRAGVPHGRPTSNGSAAAATSSSSWTARPSARRPS